MSSTTNFIDMKTKRLASLKKEYYVCLDEIIYLTDTIKKHICLTEDKYLKNHQERVKQINQTIDQFTISLNDELNTFNTLKTKHDIESKFLKELNKN